jgi:hypothetical protein
MNTKKRPIVSKAVSALFVATGGGPVSAPSSRIGRLPAAFRTGAAESPWGMLRASPKAPGDNRFDGIFSPKGF